MRKTDDRGRLTVTAEYNQVTLLRKSPEAETNILSSPTQSMLPAKHQKCPESSSTHLSAADGISSAMKSRVA
jgi:hypothetical protein